MKIIPTKSSGQSWKIKRVPSVFEWTTFAVFEAIVYGVHRTFQQYFKNIVSYLVQDRLSSIGFPKSAGMDFILDYALLILGTLIVMAIFYETCFKTVIKDDVDFLDSRIQEGKAILESPRPRWSHAVKWYEEIKYLRDYVDRDTLEQHYDLDAKITAMRSDEDAPDPGPEEVENVKRFIQQNIQHLERLQREKRQKGTQTEIREFREPKKNDT